MRKARKILSPLGPDEIRITTHALKRAKQRFNLNKNAVMRIAQKAWDAETDKKWIKKNFGVIIDPDCVVKLHGAYIFIFRKQVLVTVYLSGDKDTRLDGTI